MTILDAKTLQRIYRAECSGVALYELARLYHLHHGSLKEQLKVWRQARGLAEPVRVTQAQLCEKADEVAPADLERGVGRDWLFAK